MKNARSAMIGLVVGASALLLTSCGTQMGGAAPSAGAPSMNGAPTDALQACLARIPDGASAGQRAMAEETCRSNAANRASVVSPGTAAATSRGAAGHAGDTLEACMSRIPQDASAGQRMIAEDSCSKANAARKAVTGP